MSRVRSRRRDPVASSIERKRSVGFSASTDAKNFPITAERDELAALHVRPQALEDGILAANTDMLIGLKPVSRVLALVRPTAGGKT
jgi:hypothetical protein